MKIIADHKIPLLDPLFCSIGELVTLPAEAISREILSDAQCLILRSTTHVNASLLDGTPIQFVGTATAGIDHLDVDYLNRAGITWACAPGANAKAVRDYVLFAIVSLRQQGLLKKNNLRAGVIGVGQVGHRVVALLKTLGFEVLQNDPPRAKQESGFISTPLQDFTDLDLICLHTPLHCDGEFPTHHLIDANFLSQQKSECILLNASRGAVVDSEALKQAPHIITVLDVWENEPDIDLDLLQSARIATPHIAGYSQASKFRATHMLYNTFCEHFKITPSAAFKLDNLENTTQINLETSQWESTILQIENLSVLSDKFKQSQQFKPCRKNYPLRKELLFKKNHNFL